MVDEEIFVKAHDFIRSLFEGDGSGHDYYHSVRVHDLAVTIQRSEGGDLLLIRLAALLHDADDRKLFGSGGSRNAKGFMERNPRGCSEQGPRNHLADFLQRFGDRFPRYSRG